MDDNFLTKTLEAIESGEFSQIPAEIMTWYNSITQDPGSETWDDETRFRAMRDRYEGNFETRENGHEYIDIPADSISAAPQEWYEEVGEASKRNKRFMKRDRMNFIKDRLSQFLNSNFKGNKKREEPKKPYTSPISDPVEKYCAGVLVTSNSFDDVNVSLDYIENPKRRSSTEAFIAQQILPQGTKDDDYYVYLDSQESNLHRSKTRPYSKSLENVLIPLQPPAPSPLAPSPLALTKHRQEDPYLSPLNKLKHQDEDPYLSPLSRLKHQQDPNLNTVLPTPPPRISSRVREPTNESHPCFDSNLTQDYIEPKVFSSSPHSKRSAPLLDSPRTKPHHPRNCSTGSKRTEYILPEDTPITPMVRFDKSLSSIPVLSPRADYNDPQDFNVFELRDSPNDQHNSPHSDGLHTKPIILPKPCFRKVSQGDDSRHKPIPPPKPTRQPPRKPHRSNNQTDTSFGPPLSPKYPSSAHATVKIV